MTMNDVIGIEATPKYHKSLGFELWVHNDADYCGKELVLYSIIEEKCNGCSLCRKKCPAKAINGEPKKVHVIDRAECIKCRQCFELCKFGAVKIE